MTRHQMRKRTIPSIFIKDFTKCLLRQTDNVDQNQTAQTVQSDVKSILSGNCGNTY